VPTFQPMMPAMAVAPGAGFTAGEIVNTWRSYRYCCGLCGFTSV